MDRSLRSALLRPRHLLATLAVVVLAGGRFAAAAGSAGDLPEGAQMPFGVLWPHAGDHGAYVLADVGPDS